MDRRLIYDVGVNDGADSAFYLGRGYRVVGVEANPVLAGLLRTRFAAEILQGSFVLLDVAIGADEGEAEFWVSDTSIWSSLDKQMAAREGRRTRPIVVHTRPFGSIIAEHGVAYYCKVDIEGADRMCLKGLAPETAPQYISVEMSPADAGEDLGLLKALGYTKFKIVGQAARSQPLPWVTSLVYRLPWRLAKLVRDANRRLRGVRSVAGWRFGVNSSGPFAEDTPGPWRTYASALRLWRFLRDIDLRLDARGLHDWFDIHATR
jgi:FkbM family methyltransferase